MAKYSFEFKIMVVKEYLSGQGGYEYLGKKYSMRHKIIQNWVANYKRFGEEGLMRSRQPVMPERPPKPYALAVFD